uniref:Guanylate kinase-like domain-containing protein n=1 Tax=Rhabditophanes sp. KR3021 TaxID=114890 RepID=A0AC35TLM7_9BILA
MINIVQMRSFSKGALKVMYFSEIDGLESTESQTFIQTKTHRNQVEPHCYKVPGPRLWMKGYLTGIGRTIIGSRSRECLEKNSIHAIDIVNTEMPQPALTLMLIIWKKESDIFLLKLRSDLMIHKLSTLKLVFVVELTTFSLFLKMHHAI